MLLFGGLVASLFKEGTKTMQKQIRFRFPDVEPIAAVLGTCSCCGDDILFGETNYRSPNGTMRCRQCAPTLFDQVKEVMECLGDFSHQVWGSDQDIADLIIDADGLMATIMGSDISSVPSSVDILAFLSEGATPEEKFELVDNIVHGLRLMMTELSDCQGTA